MAITLKNRIFVLACALVLALPGLASFLVDSTAVSETEARSLAPLPGLAEARAEPWGYFRKVDAYLDDHFGLRPQLLQLNGWVRLATRSPASADVVVGRDGWLFYAEGLVSQRLDNGPDAQARLMAQADVLEAMADHVADRGGLFAVMIAPDKHTIYPEQLPWWLEGRTDPGAFSRLVDELRSRGVPVLDPRQALIEGKAQAPTYQRTDTHWTAVGATIAFNQVMREYALPPLVPDPPYVVRDVVGAPFDLARKALMGNHLSDFRIRGYALPGGKPKELALRIPKDPDRLAYRVDRPGRGATMLIIGDSFSRTYFRQMSLVHARRLTWMHHRSCDIHWPTVARLEADLVLYQVVERNLGCRPGIAEALVRRIRGKAAP